MGRGVLDESVREAIANVSQIIMPLLGLLFAWGQTRGVAMADLGLRRDEALLVVGELSHFIGEKQ
jgi:hypothetical protein